MTSRSPFYTYPRSFSENVLAQEKVSSIHFGGVLVPRVHVIKAPNSIVPTASIRTIAYGFGLELEAFLD
jgi:hypothetical protein